MSTFWAFFILLAFNIVDGATKCEYKFSGLSSLGSTTSSNDTGSTVAEYEAIESSKQCKSMVNDWENFSICSAKDVRVSLFTDTVFPQTFGYLPFIRLNMSAEVSFRSSSILFFYNCMHAPDQADNYCHDADTQLKKYGELVVPCRGLNVKDEATSFRGDINCFRLYGLSQYKVTVVVLPQNCKQQLFVTMPLDYRYDPRIHHVFDQSDPQGTLYDNWSPFLFVDTSAEDGVWVRFEKPTPKAKILEVALNLYRRNPDQSTNLFNKATVSLPSTGSKFQNLDQGEYLVVAYIKRHHCKLHCDEKTHSEVACEVCPHTMLNFTLEEDKYTEAWKKVQPFIGIGKVLLIILIVVLVFICITALSLVIYYRFIRPKVIARRPPQQFELTARPKVLIIYSDDCHQHSECVLQLAIFLKHHANAEVHIDQIDLIDPNVRPSVWLQNQIQNADFVLIVFSEGVKILLEESGKKMIQQRPYPDLFNTAIYLVISAVSRITNIAPITSLQQNGSTTTSSTTSPTSLNKFIVLRFNYSNDNVFNNFFQLARCKSFVIPDDVNQLIAHLHSVQAHDRLLEYQSDTGALHHAIRMYNDYVNQNPGFLEERFTTESETNGFAEHQELPEKKPRTELETITIGARLGLTIPEDEDEQANSAINPGVSKQEEFPLIPMEEISSSEDEG